MILVAVGEKIELVREELPSEYHNVEIRVAQGKTNLKITEMSQGVLDHLEAPGIGASFGAKEADYAGSLGVYVRDRETSKICFLTSWHCVSENDTIYSPVHRSGLKFDDRGRCDSGL